MQCDITIKLLNERSQLVEESNHSVFTDCDGADKFLLPTVEQIMPFKSRPENPTHFVYLLANGINNNCRTSLKTVRGFLTCEDAKEFIYNYTNLLSNYKELK